MNIDEYKDRILDAIVAAAESLGGYPMPMSEYPDDGGFDMFGRQEDPFYLRLKVRIEVRQEAPDNGATHSFQPITDAQTGQTIAQCTTCGHRWSGKGKPEQPCKPSEITLESPPRLHPLRRVVETDNYGGDYPDEKFVGPALSPDAAQAVADTINRDVGEHHPRYFKVVTLDYKLQPGFEP